MGKASQSKQSDLLKSKGFGLVVSKAKERNNEMLNDLAQVRSPSIAKRDDQSVASVNTPPTPVGIKKSSNSLSMLLSNYDGSSDDSEDTELCQTK